MIGTTEMINRLREKGYKITPGYLESLIREGKLSSPAKFAGRRVWDEKTIQELEIVLVERMRRVSW